MRLALTCVAILACVVINGPAWAQTQAVGGDSLTWRLEPVVMPETQFDYNSYVGAAMPPPRGAGPVSHQRITEFRLTLHGQVVRVRASMFADLVDPDPGSIRFFRLADAYQVDFTGGRGEVSRYSVTMVAIDTPYGPRVIQRHVCPAATGANRCVVTMDGVWMNN